MQNIIPFPQQHIENDVSYNDVCDNVLQIVKPNDGDKFIPVNTLGAANAIRSEDDIASLKNYFLTKTNENGRNAYNERNYALVVLGFNCGKRIGDMLDLKLSDVLDENRQIKDAFYLKEDKTEKTGRVKITTVIKQALKLYIESDRSNDDLNEPLFKSRQIDRKTKEYKAIGNTRVNQLLREAKLVLGLQGKITSHSLRKTFARKLIIDNQYNAMVISYVQKLLNHSSPKETLIYCDIMNDELDAFLENNPV